MGLLIDGRWQDVPRSTTGGAFVRRDSAFRDTVGGGPGARFPAATGRYHLIVSLACPWASRAVVVRALKRLDAAIGLTVVSPDMLENGWTFDPNPDPLTGHRYLHEVYSEADPAYSGSVTVPVLWDAQARAIVNNESSDIIRMLNRAFDAYGDAAVDLRPPALEAEIDALNDRLYGAVNNGVYKAGFATTQAAYEAAVLPLFAILDELDGRLADRRFLLGDRLTEPDVRLFTTLIRFDIVYFSHFKCNIRRIADYRHLARWLDGMMAHPGIAGTVDFDQIKRHYYFSQRWVNPTGIVPVGPAARWAGERV